MSTDAGLTKPTKSAQSALWLVVVALIAMAAVAAVIQSRPTPPQATNPASVGAAATDMVAAPTLQVTETRELQAKAVPDAQEAVQRRLIDGYGVKCLTLGEALVVRTAEGAKGLDRQISAAELSGEGWIVEDQLWLGTPEKAAQAFGANELFADETSLWMLVETKSGPRGLELSRADSESGKVTWSVLNEASECLSEDPGAD